MTYEHPPPEAITILPPWVTFDLQPDFNETGNLTDLEKCVDEMLNLPIYVHGSLLTSLVLQLILAFQKKRLHKCVNCCGGRPGIIVPLNLLDEHEDRWAYMFAYGAITNTIVALFALGGSFYQANLPPWASVLSGLLAAFEICVVFLPFFACLQHPHKLTGAVIGFWYSGCWLLLMSITTWQCRDPFPQLVHGLGFLIQGPILFCLGFLVLKFLRKIIENCCCCKPREPAPRRLAAPIQMQYVKDLLLRTDLTKEIDGLQPWYKRLAITLYNFIAKFIYRNKKNFMYSTRIMCTVFVVLMCTYQLFMVYYLLNQTVFLLFETNLEKFLDYTGIPANSTAVEAVWLGYNFLYVGWEIISFTALGVFVMNVLLVLGRYRMHKLQLNKGDRSFLPPSYSHSPTIKLWYSMMFSGYQIAYMIWAYLILYLTLCVAVILFVLIIVAPLALGNTAVILWILQIFIVPYAVSLIVKFSQKLEAYIFLIQPKINKDDKENPLAIENRRLYHQINYYYFLANVCTGLFSCLYRIGVGLVCGLFFLGRLDRCVLMPGFEFLDSGYMAYLGMLHVEHYHNNPVLRVFCHYLLETHQNSHKPRCVHNATVQPFETSQTKKEEPADMEMGREELPTYKPNRSKIARNRWWLAYTLTYNPEISDSRKVALEIQRQRQRTLLVILGKQQMLTKMVEKLKNTGQWRDAWEADIEELIDEHVDELFDEVKDQFLDDQEKVFAKRGFLKTFKKIWESNMGDSDSGSGASSDDAIGENSDADIDIKEEASTSSTPSSQQVELKSYCKDLQGDQKSKESNDQLQENHKSLKEEIIQEVSEHVSDEIINVHFSKDISGGNNEPAHTHTARNDVCDTHL